MDENTVTRADVDTGVLSYTTLTGDLSHVDAHLLRTRSAMSHTATQWARAIMEDVPADVGKKLSRGWSYLGFSLSPVGTPGTVAGWRVVAEGPDHTLLQADSWLGIKGQLLFRRSEEGVLLATFVMLRNPAARALWFTILPAHLRAVRSLLDDEKNRLTV